MDLGLSGKKAILVGASKGIGLETAKVLIGEGCDVAIGARNADAIKQAGEAVGAKFASSVDVADAEGYAAWVAEAAGALGGCDIFCCLTTASGGAADEAAWKNNFELDLMATIRGVNAALPFLEKSDAGSIVAISTTAALEDFMGVQAYNSIKAAVIAYASNLATQLAPQGIRVNTVSPGPIFNEGGPWDMIKTHMPQVYDQTVASVPMGRLGVGEEVGKTIAFLASPASSFTTGTNVVVDGGVTKRIQY